MARHFRRPRRRVLRVASVVIGLIGLSVPAADAKGPSGGGGGTAPSVTEYSQCQNGAPPSTATDCVSGWGNGILNSNNSHYAEDQVTPQRLLLSVAGGSGNHSVTIRYMTRKGSPNAHAYDSLATWNVTAVDAYACQSIATTVCSGTPSTLQMASDPTAVPPAGPGISTATSAHELPAASRMWTMYGGTLTSSSTVTHTSANRTGTDDYAKVTVNFTATSSNVLLLFGGHLARSGDASVPRAWGVGLGSANINGGPYHIILDAIDGGSIGGRDNQIQASAIIAGSPNFTVDKTADKTTAAPGDTVNYTITVTNTGTAAGSTSFTDDFDNRLDPTSPISNPTGGTCTREPAGSTNKYFNCTTSLLAAGGGQQTFTYSATMPTTFSSGAGTGGCGTGQYPVINTVTLVTGGTDTVTVCVNASPDFTVTKTANPTTANPGQQVTYTITVTNNGSAAGSTTFKDDFDDRLTPTNITFTPAGGSCTVITENGNKKLSCTTGTIAGGGGQQVITYKATMPTLFTGSPGGSNCSSTQYEIDNTVTLANGRTASAYVCVNASPTFTVVKTASKNTANPGDVITYTITVTNGGSAAGSTTFKDDFDDRITPSTVTSNPPGGTCTVITENGNKKLSCTTSTIAGGGGQQTFTYTAAMPSLFTGQPGGSTCSSSNPQQYAVINTVTLANGASDSQTVCVNASPNLTVVKTASPTVTDPGGLVTYTITVTNSGTASGSTSFKDDFDDRITPSTVTSNPPGGTCSVITENGNKKLSCTTSTIAGGGGQQTFTYTATMPTTFTGLPGGSGCTTREPHEYPVRNVVVLDNGANDDSTVCVKASPDLHAKKSVVSTTTTNGDQYLTYTIDYSNTGSAEATSAVITEAIPAGTAFVSCNPTCLQDGPPVTTVKWSVGPIAPLTGSGSVTLTVLVTATSQCTVTNTAYIQFDTDPVVASNTVVVNVSPKANPAGAHASGSSYGAKVTASGLLAVDLALKGNSATSQSGVGGPQIQNDHLLAVAVPSSGALLTTGVLDTTSSSVVTAAPPEARQTSTATVNDLCVVKALTGLCAVEATTVRSVASTTATGSSSSYSSAGTTYEGLKIAGLAQPLDLPPNTKVDLPALLFGANSYVVVDERIGSTSGPSAGVTSGGTYTADLTVNSLHVIVTGVLGLQAAEVVVAHAQAHSDFPQTTVCSAPNNQSVSGHAFIAYAAALPLVPPTTVGYVNLAPLGGKEDAAAAVVKIPADGSIVDAAVADSHTQGSLTSTTSSSTSMAEIVGDGGPPACLLKGTSSCLVSATLVKSVSNSTASSGSRSSDATGTQLVGLTVLGVPIADNPAPNTTIKIPGIGFIVLNEQTPDAPAAGHTGLTVRSVHIVITAVNPLLNLSPGVEVIVSEAHSDAMFG